MELMINRQPIFIHEILLETTLDQPMEADVLLPDYCPDIQRILRCSVTPSITSRQAVGDKLQVDGSAGVVVHYLTPENSMHTVEYALPFSRSVELKGDCQSPIVTIDPTVDYVNCRAVSQRRMDIRGAISIAVRVEGMREEQAVTDAQGMGVELRRDARKGTRIVAQACRPFSIKEEMELGYGKPPVECVLRTDGFVRCLDQKVILHKVIIKGELVAHFMYRCDGRYELCEFNIPFNQIVDVDNVTEDSICDVQLELGSICITPKEDTDGQNTRVAVEASLWAKIRAHEHYEMLAAKDCYSTKYDCSYASKQLPTLQLTECVNRVHPFKETLDLPEGVQSIDDMWAQVQNCEVRKEPGCAVVAGKLCISLFGENEENCTAYYEQEVDFEERVPLPEGCDDYTFRPTAKAVGCTHTMTSHDRVEVRCDIEICGCIYCMCKTTVIGDISVNADHEKVSNTAKGLYIYLADPGEDLWNVAKRYNTSIRRIMEENDLTSETAGEREMLLIPVI